MEPADHAPAVLDDDRELPAAVAGRVRRDRLFIANESGGTWGDAQVVPGPEGTQPAIFGSLSCASAGDCAIGGSFGGRSTNFTRQVFVADEVNGTITSGR